MLKHTALCLLFLPGLALADCGVVRADGAVHIVVGRNATTCFAGAFRENFLSDLNEALAAEDNARAAAAGSTASGARHRPPALRAPEGSRTGGQYYGAR